MALLNDRHNFGGVAKTLHWLTALLIFTAIPLGIIGTNSDVSSEEGIARAAWIFSLHKTVGVTAFTVALVRILWALTQERPAHLNPQSKVQTFLADMVHWLLYVALLLVPLSGWLHHAAATGYAPILWPFGQDLPFVPKSEHLSHLFEGWHFVLTKILAVAIMLHVAGAIKHHIIDKDGTLRRMLPGRTDIGTLPAHDKSRKPALAALVIYLAALGAGTAIGLSYDRGPEAVALQEVDSEWTVQSGTIGITVKQLGSDVSGSFSDWTADISFDEASETGSVRAVIATGSLTLGSVTRDALGPDYLDAVTSPEAVFDANISRSGEAFVADGTLTLKGVTMPLQLPFTLDIVDGVATAKGQTTLNRIDFGVGATAQPSEGSLGFAVIVDLDLTATAPK